MSLTEYYNKKKAKDLARLATEQHQRVVDWAREYLAQSLELGDDESKRLLSVATRNREFDDGYGTSVTIAERLDDGHETHHLEILVATKQDNLQATDLASATPVSFTTKAASVIVDPETGPVLVKLREESTTKVIQ